MHALSNIVCIEVSIEEQARYALNFYYILWWLEIYPNLCFSDAGQDLEEHT